MSISLTAVIMEWDVISQQKKKKRGYEGFHSYLQSFRFLFFPLACRSWFCWNAREMSRIRQHPLAVCPLRQIITKLFSKNNNQIVLYWLHNIFIRFQTRWFFSFPSLLKRQVLGSCCHSDWSLPVLFLGKVTNIPLFTSAGMKRLDYMGRQ